MSHNDMRSYHTVQKDLTSWSAWLLTRAVLAATAILSLSPFITSYVPR